MNENNGVPGPGTYLLLRDVKSVDSKKDSNFLTNTKREDWWDNNIDAPFTKPSNINNPDPGRY